MSRHHDPHPPEGGESTRDATATSTNSFAKGSCRKALFSHLSKGQHGSTRWPRRIHLVVQILQSTLRPHILCAFFQIPAPLEAFIETCKPLVLRETVKLRYPMRFALYRLYNLYSSRTTTRVAAWALSSRSVCTRTHQIAGSCIGHSRTSTWVQV